MSERTPTAGRTARPSAIPAAIREILACPRCRGPLDDSPDGEALACGRCHLRFPVRDGIPILLLDQDLMALDPIWAAAGSPMHVFRTSPAELHRITGATVAEVKEAG